MPGKTACSQCGGQNGVHQEWCTFNPKRREPAIVLTPPTMGGYAPSMTNTSATQTPAPTTPANAVTEAQAFRMLGNMGITEDLIAGAFYRLRTRFRTVLSVGTCSYRFDRLAEDIFVVTAVPTSNLR